MTRTIDISHEIDAELLMEGALATGDSEDEAKWGVEYALESFTEEHRGKVALVTYISDVNTPTVKKGERAMIGGRLGLTSLNMQGRPERQVQVRRRYYEPMPRQFSLKDVCSIYVFTDEDLRAAYAPETAVLVRKYGGDYNGVVKEQKRTRVLVEFRTLGGNVKQQWFSMNSTEMWPANGFGPKRA